jgi:hypothetical protein
MKINLRTSIDEQAAVLLTCLVIGGILGVTLASFMILGQSEYASVCRSQTWNRTLPVTEAGVEEAMALLNKYSGTTNPITSWTNAAAADGWTVSGNVYQITRNLGPDSYTVSITNNASPSILSVATLGWNGLYASAAAPQPMFAAIGVPAPSPSTSVRRAVLIQTAPPTSYFLFQILAKKGITISGGGTNDSVNSLDPNYAANPWSLALEHANGSIGTIESGTGGAFNESSSSIYGHVHTGAGSTATVSGGSGGIGDVGWLPSNGGKIESGWVDDTLNITVPDAPPAPTGVTVRPMPGASNNVFTLSGSPGTTTYYSIPAGLNVSGGGTVLITNGNVCMICQGALTLSGGSGIVISKGSSLSAYFNGQTTLSGGGVINATGYATNCSFYGSTSCTKITYSGSSSFIGTVWAPYADYTQSGGSGVIGALIINSFTQSGGKSLMRYDEALGGGPSGSVYRIAAWQEVAPQ